MRSNLSKLVVGIASVVALGGTVPAPAMASFTVQLPRGVCAFNGHADVNANAVQWVGGGGNWGFHSNIAICATSAGAETALIRAGTAAGSGTYASLVCGTTASGGDAIGDMDITPTGLGATLAGAGTVDIQFVAGAGIISGLFTQTGEPRPGEVDGFAEILPNGSPQTGPLPGFGGSANQPDPPPPIGAPDGTCVNEYAVAGALSVYRPPA